jgi:hypothetical protein
MLVQSAPDVFSLAENGKGQTLATQSQAKQSGLEPGHDQTSSKSYSGPEKMVKLN